MQTSVHRAQKISFLRPTATFTVECTTGTPNALIVRTVDTAFLTSSS
jgi:hypothetical protein